MMHRFGSAVFATMLAMCVARAELLAGQNGLQPRPSPAPETRSGAAVPSSAATPPESYTYLPDGRRDPFVTLLGTGMDSRAVAHPKRVDGPAGLLVGEIAVRGIMQGNGGPLAMIQGSDKRTYVIHPGEKLMDGAVKAITPQGLIIVQDVNDPLSVVKHREVRKMLRSFEDGRP